MAQSMTVNTLRLARGVRRVESARSAAPARPSDLEQAVRLGARQAEQELERLRVRVLVCC